MEGSNILKVRPNGPNVVTGRVVLTGARATSAKTSATLVLCRCGLSKDKPFCDGTHIRMGFAEPGLLPADAQPGTPMIGEVTITPTRDGPLECRGPLTIQSADGRMSSTEETWLCRCGHSRTKPFCDGSHKKVGFSA